MFIIISVLALVGALVGSAAVVDRRRFAGENTNDRTSVQDTYDRAMGHAQVHAFAARNNSSY